MKQKWILAGLFVVVLVVLATRIKFKQSPPLTEQTQSAVTKVETQATGHGGKIVSDSGQPEPNDSVQPQPNIQIPETEGPLISLQEIPDGEFKSGLEGLDGDVRQRVLRKLAENRQLLGDVDSIRVDANGMIYYVCTFEGRSGMPESGAGEAPEEAGSTTGSGTVPISSPPVLHSRPGAQNVLFLDFNGHVIEGTAWNSSRDVSSWNCRPYDKDGDDTTFSTAELAIITQVWERVAEDFSPFDVDVTTEEPETWNRYTGHALITPTTDADGVSCPHNGYGGIAYVDVFADSWYSYDYSGNCYSPAWCVDYGGDDAAEVISHELGHNLALSHDKWSDGAVTNGYYSGHDNGGIPWGPIMGTGYNDDSSQWSKGDYLHAYDSNQDDLDIIADRLAYRPDDHGDSIGEADPLSVDGTGFLVGNGVIETTGDPDVFSFDVSGGEVEVYASPYRASSGTWGGNLDIKLSLFDNTSTLIATNNPALETKAAISTSLPAGTYYLRVEPTAMGDPLADPPTGYVLYGSLGQYDLNVIPPGGLTILSNVEGFESGSYSIWKQGESDDIDWTAREGTTPSSSTGPSSAAAGNVYLYTEATSPNYPGKVAMLESIRLNFGSIVPGLIFDHHMYGADMGTLSVDVYDGTWHNDVWSCTGQQHVSETDAWTTATVDLSAFAGKQDVMLRFRGTTGSGYTSDMAIDNIRLSYDIDADGLPDTWEFQYFGNATSAVASADFDNDGFDNLAESVSGHNPTNPESYFNITSLTAEGATGMPFVIRWEPVMGRVYGVLWGENLTSSLTNISGDLPYPAGSYTDTVNRAGPQHFYRIEVKTAP